MKLLVIAFLACTSLHSDQNSLFVVIVNKGNKLQELSPSKIKLIFLRKISRWPWGAEITPVDLPDQTPTRRAFVKSIMESTPDQMELYWIDQKVSRGLYPPLRVPNTEAAKQWVATRPGGVAYIPASDVDSTVRVLQVK